MVTEVKMSQTALYETDFVCWSETTAQYLRNKSYHQVDWENLIEEIEDMSRLARKSLKSNLIVVLLHLLKWQYSHYWSSEVPYYIEIFRLNSETI